MVVLSSFPSLTQLMTPYLVNSVAHKGLGLLTSLNLIKIVFYGHATDKSSVGNASLRLSSQGVPGCTTGN